MEYTVTTAVADSDVVFKGRNGHSVGVEDERGKTSWRK